MCKRHCRDVKDRLTDTGGESRGIAKRFSGDPRRRLWSASHSIFPVDQFVRALGLAERSEATCIKPSARTTITTAFQKKKTAHDRKLSWAFGYGRNFQVSFFGVIFLPDSLPRRRSSSRTLRRKSVSLSSVRVSMLWRTNSCSCSVVAAFISSIEAPPALKKCAAEATHRKMQRLRLLRHNFQTHWVC